MSEAEYIEQRVDDQMNWYDKKSGWNRRWHQRLKVLEIVGATTIPFLTGYLSNNSLDLRIVVGILGLLVALSSALAALYKFQENWITYRMTAESLKREKLLYLTKGEPYQGENDLALFVTRIENLLSREHSSWTQYVKKAEKKS